MIQIPMCFVRFGTLRRWLLVQLGLALLLPCATVAAAEEPIEFNRDIRPILAEKCIFCHGQDANQRQGDLRLDVRDAALDAGAIVPHDAAASTLIERITATDP